MTDWTLDTAHANVEFSIKHMMITTIRGRFQELALEVDFDDQAPERSSVVARIATASITTNEERRDGHLRSPDFLDVEKYPEMIFRSTSVAKFSDRDFQITGDLTIRDQTHQVVLERGAARKCDGPAGRPADRRERGHQDQPQGLGPHLERCARVGRLARG